MLGSDQEADDAVQEAWLRASRAGADDVDNLDGWLTTIVARVCLTTLQRRRARAEEPLEAEPVVPPVADDDPAELAVRADAVGVALLVVLETLSPPERLAFVLHDLFALPFEEIAPIVERSPAAARQLASRARRRVQGAPGPAGSGAWSRRRSVVDAFLAASRSGDLRALVALLDPDAVLRADGAAVALGASPEARGAAAVAETFAGRARAARPVLVDGAPGAVWTMQGRARVVFDFVVAGDRIVTIDLLADPELLAGLELVAPG